MMMTQTMTATRTANSAARFNRMVARRNWMVGSSAIAAAAAFTSAATPAFAQAAPRSSMSGVVVTGQDRFEAARAGSRSGNGSGIQNRRGRTGAGRGGIDREIPSVDTVPNAPVGALPTLNGNPVAMPSQTQVNGGAVPSIPTVQLDPNQGNSGVPIIRQSAEPVERAINAAPGEAGINVRAFAQFDDVQIDFTPGVAADIVNVLDSTAIINWTTFDAGASGSEVTFLGTGGNLQFNSSLSDYTVLNRVLTPGFDSAIRIDGDIESTILGGAAVGGSIWFYSAGGIIVGDTGSFNVGSLLLSTSEIDPLEFSAGTFDVAFTGTSDSASAIQIDGGATLRANNSNSYIALVAPRIVQEGTVTANGSVAYVAAEQAVMTIENGLFDISVTVGTEDANGIVHSETGSTGGAASTGITDEQAIYFVAVPKNDAISMLVGGAIGYDAAASASISNGQIILTTGDRVERQTSTQFISGMGFVDVSTNRVDMSVDGGPAGDVTIENIEFTSDTDIFSEGSITLQAGVTNAADFITVDDGSVNGADLNLTAGDSVNVNVTANGRIDVTGSLNIAADDGLGNGGNINVSVDAAGAASALGGGTLQVGGTLSLDTSAAGLDDNGDIQDNGGTGIGGDGFGGDVTLDLADGGVLDIGGSLNITTDANGGGGLLRHGASAAGDFTMNVGAATVNVGGDVSVDAIGRSAGTFDRSLTAEEGSDSVGGNVTINLTDGSFNAGRLAANVGAEASLGTDVFVVQSNDATAGDFTLNVTGGSHTFGSIDVTAATESARSRDGSGDSDGIPGGANRGLTAISVSNAGTLLSVTGDVFVFADTLGDTSASRRDVASVSVLGANAGNGGGFVIGGDLIIVAPTEGGGIGELTLGGNVDIFTDDGLLSTGGLDVDIRAFRNGFFSAFDAQGTDFVGGNLTITATNGGTLEFNGTSDLNANATGGATENDPGAGIGRGGTITILADDGTINFGGDLTLRANGFAFAGVNDAGAAGQGIGGTVDITVQGDTGNLIFADVDAGTDGSFEFDGEVVNTFFIGAGSSGVGGQTTFNVLGGSLSAADITVSSDGEGGPGGELPDGTVGANGLLTTGDGGAGTGGEVTFNIDGGDASVDNLTVTASGLGGDGAFGSGTNGTNAGSGGAAVGGTATLNALSGDLTVTDTLSVEATGNRLRSSGRVSGGDGGNGFGSAGGDAGSSVGGNAVFNLTGTANVTANDVIVSTQAFGGEGGDSFANFSGDPDQGGGDGGDAVGGDAVFNDTAGNISFGTLTVNSSGVGGVGGGSFGNTTGDALGEGGAGGNGTGGTALISLNQDDADSKNYSVISQGQGGNGGQGATGGAGGFGVGGIAELAINNVSVVFDQLAIDAAALGGDGGFIDGQVVAAGAAGGDSEGGEARLVITGADADFQVASSASLSAGATGGVGREGSFSFDDQRDAGNGGAGGNATGGSASIIVSDNAQISIIADAFTFNADSSGGAGGDGGDNFGSFTGRPGTTNAPITSVSGDGGAGGTGTAGAVGVIATSGADVTIAGGSGPLTLSAIGSGGNGGEGGLASSRGTQAGNGGAGGAGIGGSPFLRVDGATITTDDITFIAQGGGATAGDGGDNDVGGPSGAGANGGIGVGGTPLIELTGGIDGEISLGDVTILANGTGGEGTRSAADGIGGGGQVTIRDTSVDPTGTNVFDIFGDLTIDATGDVASDSGVITIASNGTAIFVDGAVTADVTGQMDLIFAGDARIEIFGDTTLTATSGINIIRPVAVPDNTVIRTDGAFTALVTAGDFDASADAEIRSERFVSITAENVNHGAITSERSTSITATNGDITSNRLIFASAVNDAIILTATGDVTFGILNNVDGDPATRDGNININAGGSIIGGSATSGQTINLNAPGLVRVSTVDTSATNIGTVTINGGMIDLGTLNARFISNLTSDTGDLAIDTITGLTDVNLDSAANIIIGTADTSGFSADALAGNIFIGSLTTTGATSFVRLTAGGDISYNSIDASSLANLVGDTITGGDLVAAAGVDLTAGSIDIGDTRSTGGFVLLTSTLGDIVAGAVTSDNLGATVDSAGSAIVGDITTNSNARVNSVGDAIVGDVDANGSAVINAGGNLTAGDLFSGTNSPGMTLTVAGDADIASATANGLLNVNVDGALSGGDFVGQGPFSLVTINAASVDIASAQSLNQTLNITTSGAAIIGNAVSGVNTTINGASVTLDSGDVGQDLRVTSSVGDITGLGSITVGRAANFNSAADIAIGTLEASTIALTAAGDLRFNGLISPNAITLSAINGTIGATTPGEGDIDSGGAVDLTAEAIDLGDIDSDGSITADASAGDASFGALTAGTFITIDAKGSPSVESVTSGGNVTLTGASIALDGGDIGGDLVLDAQDGDITLAFDGTQQLLVAGNASFDATGDMSVTHTNNDAGTVSIDVGAPFRIDVGGAFNSAPGSIVSSGSELVITTGGDLTADDLRAEAAIDLGAGGNVLLNNAVATGPQGISNLRGITIRAGLFDLGSGLTVFDNIASATITGDVSSYADINVTAGGNAVFAAGSVTAADNSLTVNTGDDIIVEAGALLSSANNPTDAIDPLNPFEGGPNLTLNAGGEQNLLSLPATPIASLVMDGTLDANDGAIILLGNAIQGLDSTLIAGSISADIVDAPPGDMGLSDDDGLLSKPCVEGIICLGDMTATGRIAIGQNSNNDVIQLFVQQATISATDILITTRNDIVMGTNGIDTQLNATGTFSATSNTGNVDLRDASIAADQILIDAAGSVLGTGVLTSANDIGITVGDSIIVGGIVTDGELTQIADVGGPAEGFYSVDGDFIAGIYSQGSADIDLFAGGIIDIGQADSPDNITLSALDVFLGLASVPGEISIDGGSIGFDSLDAGSAISLSGGGVFGGDLFSGNISVDGDQIDIGDVDAADTASISGTSIAVRNVIATDIDLSSGSDILFDSLTSTNAINLNAENGSIAANNGPGDIISDGDVNLSALQIAISDVTSQGSVTADASLGDATFGVVDAAQDITITASGSPSVLNAISGGDTTISGASVTFDNGTIGGDLTLNAADGDIDGNGAVSVGGGIEFTASGNVGFGALTAAGGSFVVDAGGDLAFVSATSTDFIDLTAGGSVMGGDLNAANAVSVDAQNIAVGDVIADEINLTSATDILFNLIQSPNAISLTATAGVIGANTGPGDIISGSDVVLLAEFIDVNEINAGGAVTATATGTPAGTGGGGSGGPVVIGGGGNDEAINTANINAGGVVTLTAVNGPIVTGDIDAASNIIVNGASISLGDIIARGPANGGFGGGIVDLDASGDVAFGEASNQGNFNIDAGGNIDFGSIVSNFGSIRANAGGSITIDDASTVRRDGSASTQDIALDAGQDITITGSLDTDDSLSLAAGGNITAGDLTGALGIGQVNVNADGNVTLGDVTSANTITTIRGNEVTTGSVTGGGIAITARAGSLIVGGPIDGQQGVTLSASEDVDAEDISAGTSAAITGQAIAFGNAATGGAFSATGDTIDFTSVDAGTDVTLTANSGALIGARVDAGGSANLTAGAGAITLEGLTAENADLLAAAEVTIDDAVIGTLLTADGTAIEIVSSESLTADVNASDGDVSVLAAGGLNAQNASATGNVSLATNDGGLTVGNASGEAIDLVSAGAVEITGIVDANGALRIDAINDFTLNGTATAQTIDVTAMTVDIGADGILGDATRTQTITFNATGEVGVGGDGTDNPPPFHLENTEFARVFSGGDIIFNAFASGSAADALLTLGRLDVIAGDGSSATGQNIGQNGALILNADGDINIVGNATITGATANTTFAADALNLVRLNTQTGGIFLTDANGALAGLIEIAATDFNAVTDAAFADIQGLSVEEIDARLANSDGVERADGVIRADTLDIATTASQVFIQNTVSGTDFDQRRGFDVNTLNISSGGGTGSLQPIVINGVIAGVTGFNAIPQANLASPLNAASTINGCVIANPASCAPTVTPPTGGPTTPVGGPTTPSPVDPDSPEGLPDPDTRDLIEEGLEPEQVIQAGSIEGGLIEIRPDAAFTTDPLIDDPVTGAGNEDLWVSDEEECEEDDSCS